MFSARFSILTSLLVTGYFQSEAYNTEQNWVSVGGETYLGCYKDDSSRDLSQRFSDHLTVEECFDQVKEAGLKYGGLQYTHECYGGDSLDYPQKPDSDCDLKCDGQDGDDDRFCGGGWRNSVFDMENYVVSTQRPNPGVKGDPHFRTWAGEPYDFHGICDLVLLKNDAFENGLGMDIHLRTTKYSLWSYISAVALRIGEDIFEVIGGSKGNTFWINGVPGRNEEVESENEESRHIAVISGYSVYYKQKKKGGEFTFIFGKEEMITIGIWNLFVSVQFKNANNKHFGDSVGLMGSFLEGRKLARDNITELKDVNVFGQEWQVLNSEPKLFHVDEGPQHPLKCKIPSSSQLRRRLEESSVTVSDARKACVNVNKDDFDLCVFDIMATNDESTAGAY